MNYALVFFGPILVIGIMVRIITGDFPQGIALIALWSISLAGLFVYGYRRLYTTSGEAADEAPEEEK